MIPPWPRASSAGSSPWVQRDDRLHVQAHELALPLHAGRGERTVGGDAGVVDEQLDLERCRSREQRVDSGGGREIGDERLDPAAARAHLLREGPQSLFAARDREHGMAAACERERELAAEAGRGAGDDRPPDSPGLARSNPITSRHLTDAPHRAALALVLVVPANESSLALVAAFG